MNGGLDKHELNIYLIAKLSIQSSKFRKHVIWHVLFCSIPLQYSTETHARCNITLKHLIKRLSLCFNLI